MHIETMQEYMPAGTSGQSSDGFRRSQRFGGAGGVGFANLDASTAVFTCTESS